MSDSVERVRNGRSSRGGWKASTGENGDRDRRKQKTDGGDKVLAFRYAALFPGLAELVLRRFLGAPFLLGGGEPLQMDSDATKPTTRREETARGTRTTSLPSSCAPQHVSQIQETRVDENERRLPSVGKRTIEKEECDSDVKESPSVSRFIWGAALDSNPRSRRRP
jgi:hypothetical protein